MRHVPAVLNLGCSFTGFAMGSHLRTRSQQASANLGSVFGEGSLLPQRYDAVSYVDQTTRARPLPSKQNPS